MAKGKRISALDRAGAKADTYIASQLVGVLKDLRGIVKESTDERARVGAAGHFLAWARPKKPMISQTFNLPAINSKLGLPAAPPSLRELTTIDVTVLKKEVPRIAPEPAKSIGDGLRPFAKKEIEPSGLEMPKELALRSPKEREPDKPKPAASIKPYE